jgi:hypothetical protein
MGRVWNRKQRNTDVCLCVGGWRLLPCVYLCVCVCVDDRNVWLFPRSGCLGRSFQEFLVYPCGLIVLDLVGEVNNLASLVSLTTTTKRVVGV